MNDEKSKSLFNSIFTLVSAFNTVLDRIDIVTDRNEQFFEIQERLITQNQKAFELAREDFFRKLIEADLKNRIIHVTRTKNWEVRDIPMNESLTKILKGVIDKSSKESPYVFVSHRTGRPFRDVKSGFKAALRRIGLGGFRFHDLRHTWCSRMCELGIDEATIMELGGWKTRSMINRYAHPSMDHKREALEKLNKVPLNFTLDEKPTTLIKLDKSAN